VKHKGVSLGKEEEIEKRKIPVGIKEQFTGGKNL